jgi:hypothetical protein
MANTATVRSSRRSARRSRRRSARRSRRSWRAHLAAPRRVMQRGPSRGPSRLSCVNVHTHEIIWFLEAPDRRARVGSQRSSPGAWDLHPGHKRRSLTGDRRRSPSVQPRLGVREVPRGAQEASVDSPGAQHGAHFEVPKRHLWTRPALNMALNLRPRHRRPRIDRRAAPLVKWAMHSARPNFTSAAHRE